ncbi:MAG: hypothetical protein ACJ762_15475 [Solirubrobacteraceae bacterium]
MLSSRSLVAPLIVLALGAAPSHAQVAGDTGQAPTNAAECRAFLKSVDADLKWENHRYAKERGKLLAERAKVTKRIAGLELKQTRRQERIDVLMAALEAEPPPAQDEASAMNIEMSELNDAMNVDSFTLKDLKTELKGYAPNLAAAKKLHQSNVRNTIKYRKQVADYCKRF